MVVHAHDAGDHGVSVQIEHGRAWSRRDVSPFADSDDLVALNHPILIVSGGPSRAIDHTHMGQHNPGCIHPNKRLHGLGKFGSLRGCRQQKEKQREGLQSDASHMCLLKVETLYATRFASLTDAPSLHRIPATLSAET